MHHTKYDEMKQAFTLDAPRKAAVMEHSRKSPVGCRAYTSAATFGFAYGPANRYWCIVNCASSLHEQPTFWDEYTWADFSRGSDKRRLGEEGGGGTYSGSAVADQNMLEKTIKLSKQVYRNEPRVRHTATLTDLPVRT